MEISPGDTVIRISPVPREPARERSGLREYALYEVADVAGDATKLVGIRDWCAARFFDVVLDEPCA